MKEAVKYPDTTLKRIDSYVLSKCFTCGGKKDIWARWIVDTPWGTKLSCLNIHCEKCTTEYRSKYA